MSQIQQHYPRVIGHRGASGYVTENTIASFYHALSLGCDWIEMDIRACASGELVVFHDDTLTRLAGDGRAVADIALDELTTIRLEGKYFIPSLADVLRHLAGRARLFIELKEEHLAERLAHLVTPMVEAGLWDWQDLYFISFLHPELPRLRKYVPQCRMAPIIVGLPEDYAAFGTHLEADAVHPCIHFINEDFMIDAKRRNLPVHVWTCNEPAHIQRALDLGVHAIASDFPDRVIKLIGERPKNG